MWGLVRTVRTVRLLSHYDILYRGVARRAHAFVLEVQRARHAAGHKASFHLTVEQANGHEKIMPYPDMV